MPRRRQGWPDTPTTASSAVAEWAAASRGRRAVAPGREMVEQDPQLWARYTEQISQLREQLAGVPVADRDTWASVARHTAGAFAAWSSAVEPVPGDLAAAADALAVSAQTYRRPPVDKARMVAVSGAAMLLASAAAGGQGTLGQAVLLRQLVERLDKGLLGQASAARFIDRGEGFFAGLGDYFKSVGAVDAGDPCAFVAFACGEGFVFFL